MSGAAVKQASGFQIAQAPKPAEAPDPQWDELLPLPGGPTGVPLFVSNNPEKFRTDGVFAGTMLPATSKRTLDGSIPPLSKLGYYLYHINDTGGTRRIHVIASTPETRPVKVRVHGAMFANGWAIKNTPCVHTAMAMITKWPIDREVVIQPRSIASIGYCDVNYKHCVDARFALDADGAIYVRDISAPPNSSASTAYGFANRMSDGHIASPVSADEARQRREAAAAAGRSQQEINKIGPAIGRACGLYSNDSWRGALQMTVDKAPFCKGYKFNDVSQAFKAIVAMKDSAKRLDGNYGVLYELDVDLENGSGMDTIIMVQFASYPAKFPPDKAAEYVLHCKKVNFEVPTRIWDGPIEVVIDGKETQVHALTRPRENPSSSAKPGLMRATIVSRQVKAGGTMKCKLRIPVPGLISYPAAILIRAVATTSAAANARGWKA